MDICLYGTLDTSAPYNVAIDTVVDVVQLVDFVELPAITELAFSWSGYQLSPTYAVAYELSLASDFATRVATGSLHATNKTTVDVTAYSGQQVYSRLKATVTTSYGSGDSAWTTNGDVLAVEYIAGGPTVAMTNILSHTYTGSLVSIFDLDRAFDNSTSTWFQINSAVPSRFTVQIYGSAYVITRFKMWGRDSSDYPDWPEDFTLQGSNDGTNFTTVNTETGVAFQVPGVGHYDSGTVDNAGSYIYYKFEATRTTGPNRSDTYLNISQLQLIGYIESYPIIGATLPAATFTEIAASNGRGAALMFDNSLGQLNSATVVGGGDVVDGWQAVELKNPYIVTSYRVWARNIGNAEVNGFPSTFNIEGSVDGVAWTVLDTKNVVVANILPSGNVPIPEDAVNGFIASPAAYSHYRFVCKVPSNNEYYTVGELQLIGYPD